MKSFSRKDNVLRAFSDASKAPQPKVKGESSGVMSVHIPTSMRSGDGAKALTNVIGKLNQSCSAKVAGERLMTVEFDEADADEVIGVLDASGLQWQRE